MLNLLNKAISNPNKPAAKAASLDSNRGSSNIIPRRGNSVQMIDPASIKSDMFSSQAMNFINAASNEFGSRYGENQLLGAYMTSVYMFSALRRVANLISRVKIVAEIKENGKFVRAPEDFLINQIFAKQGSEILSKMWLNYAVYGSTAVYKVKTRRAKLEEDAGRPIYDYKDAAVAGLFVIDKPMWSLDEDASYGQINGLYVNQYNMANSVIGSRNYLKRREFVYVTDWNPVNPNQGKSIVEVAIHEAVANAAIAQWMAEYFTRGAMPFIMVSMEDDPAMMTDADLRKYKRQFEEHWQGIGSSLRSVFFDRSIKAEKIGIDATDVAAPELNETALEGIAAAVGLDRELVVTPSGGSQERHEALIMRAWNDTIKPMAEKFLVGFNRDLGLPPNVQLVLDLDGITELEADRQDKSDTEINIFNNGLQDINETRKRLKMPPIDDLENWYTFDGKPTPLEIIKQTANVPHQSVLDYATSLWDGNLAKRSEVLEMMGRKLPPESRDGYKYDIEQGFDFVTGLWGEDLLTRSQVLSYIGYTLAPNSADGYRSEIERGSDYGEFVTGLWSDNLLTRSQTISLLDMGITLPEGSPDGYADEIGDRKQNVLDLWGENLIPRTDAMKRLGVKIPDGMANGFKGEVEAVIENTGSELQTKIDNVMEFWDNNLLTRESVIEILGLPKPANVLMGYNADIEKAADDAETQRNNVLDLWDKNLLRRSDVLNEIGYELPVGAIDDFQQAVDIIAEAIAEKDAADLTAPPTEPEPPTPPPDGGGSPFGGNGFNSIAPPTENKETAIDTIVNEIAGVGEPETAKDLTSNIETETDLDSSDLWNELFHSDNAAVQTEIEEELDSSEDWNVNRIDDPMQEESKLTIDVMEDADLLNAILPENERLEIEEDTIDQIVAHLIGIEKLPDDMDATEMLNEATADALMQPAANNYTYLASERHNEPTMTDDIQTSLQTMYLNDVGATEAMAVIEKPQDEIEAVENKKLYVSLSLSNNEMVKYIQDEFVSKVDNSDSLNLQTPETYHITLAYMPYIDDETVQKALTILPSALSAPTLQIQGVDYWDTEDGKVVKLDVVQTEELINLQQKIVMAFNSFGLPISEYTQLGEHHPHITIAYAGSDFEAPPYSYEAVMVRPDKITFGRDGYKEIAVIPLNDRSDTWDKDAEPYVDYAEFSKMIMPRERYEEKAALDNMIKGMWIKRIKQWMDGHTDEILPLPILKAISEYGASQESLEAAIEAVESGDIHNDEDQTWHNGENPLKAHIKSAPKLSDSTLLKEIEAWEKTSIRQGVTKGLKFKNKALSDELTAKVKAALGDITGDDRESIQAVFEAAKNAVIKTPRVKQRLTKERLDKWSNKATTIKTKFNIPPDEDDTNESLSVDNED